MTIQRMEHVGVVVDDLAAATVFFVGLGLELQSEGSVDGGWERVGGRPSTRFMTLRCAGGESQPADTLDYPGCASLTAPARASAVSRFAG